MPGKGRLGQRLGQRVGYGLKGCQAWVDSGGQVGENVCELEFVPAGWQGTNIGGDLDDRCWGLGRSGRRKTLQFTHDATIRSPVHEGEALRKEVRYKGRVRRREIMRSR